MGHEIHTLETRRGVMYREYSTTSGMYQTPSLTGDEMRLYLLSISYEGGLNATLLGIERQFQNVQSKSGWGKKPTDYWGKRFSKQRSKKAFLADTQERLDTPLRELLKEGIDAFRNTGHDPESTTRLGNQADGLLKLL